MSYFIVVAWFVRIFPVIALISISLPDGNQQDYQIAKEVVLPVYGIRRHRMSRCGI